MEVFRLIIHEIGNEKTLVGFLPRVGVSPRSTQCFYKFYSDLAYGHECWIIIEKVRSLVQADEMGFLRKISGLTLLDIIKSAVIRQCLNIESLILGDKRSQLRWYGQWDMCHECSRKEQPKNCSVQHLLGEGPVP